MLKFLPRQICVAVLLFLSACKTEEQPCTDPTNPECPNFDQCLVFQPADANFIITDSIYGINCQDGRGRLDMVDIIEDTATAGDLYFRAHYDADTYAWTVGSDPKIHTTKSFSLYFQSQITPADIDIQLIACKTPPGGCSFQTCDTVIRRIHLIDIDLYDSAWSYVIGSFKGVDTDKPLDSFTITIPPVFPLSQGILNFPNGCEGQYLYVSVFRNQFLLHKASFPCQEACGIGTIMDDKRTLVIDYSVKDGNERKLKKFIGRRL